MGLRVREGEILMPAVVAVVAVSLAGTAGTTMVGGLVTFGLAGGIAASVIGGIVIGAVVGGITAAVMGGDILKGALMGGLVGGVVGGVQAFGGVGGAIETGAAAGDMVTIPGEAAMFGTAAADALPAGIVIGSAPGSEILLVTGSNAMGEGVLLEAGSVGIETGAAASDMITIPGQASADVVSTGTELVGAAEGTSLGAQLLAQNATLAAQTAKSQMIGNIIQGVGVGGASMLQSSEAEDLADTEYERNKKKLQEGVNLQGGTLNIDKEAYAKSPTSPSRASVKPYLKARPTYVSSIPRELLNKA